MLLAARIPIHRNVELAGFHHLDAVVWAVVGGTAVVGGREGMMGRLVWCTIVAAGLLDGCYYYQVKEWCKSKPSLGNLVHSCRAGLPDGQLREPGGAEYGHIDRRMDQPASWDTVSGQLKVQACRWPTHKPRTQAKGG